MPLRWGDLGLTGAQWSKRPIQRYGRNSASGTWGFFKQQALCKGDFRSDVAEFPGSAAVVQAVAGNSRSIGYASFGFHLSGVKMLAVMNDQGQAITPDADAIRSGRYPIEIERARPGITATADGIGIRGNRLPLIIHHRQHFYAAEMKAKTGVADAA